MSEASKLLEGARAEIAQVWMPLLTVIPEFNVLEDRGACRGLLGDADFERRFPKGF